MPEWARITNVRMRENQSTTIALLTNLRFYNRSKSDEGQYTCRSVLNHSINATVMIIVDGMCLFN